MFSTYTIGLLLLHFLLYRSWKIPAMYEKRSRKNGSSIPVYASGDFGDWIGFSLLVYGFSLMALLQWHMYFFVFVTAIVVTFLLHSYWKQSALGKTVSLYDENGVATLSGLLHLPYVLFATFVIISSFFHIVTVESADYFWAVLGGGIYLTTGLLDKYRGVI